VVLIIGATQGSDPQPEAAQTVRAVTGRILCFLNQPAAMPSPGFFGSMDRWSKSTGSSVGGLGVMLVKLWYICAKSSFVIENLP